MCADSADTRGVQNYGKQAEIKIKHSLKSDDISFLIFLNAGTGFLFFLALELSMLTLFLFSWAGTKLNNFGDQLLPKKKIIVRIQDLKKKM